MSDKSFVSAVKAELFFHLAFSLITGEFAIFPELVRDRILGFISDNM
jgi:hypothetical protein